MKSIYLVPAVLLAGRDIGAHHALECPDPSMRLLVVEQWISDVAQDAFEAHPLVTQLHPWDADKPAPASLVAAFTTAKSSSVADVSALDTVSTALWKIRAGWPMARY